MEKKIIAIDESIGRLSFESELSTSDSEQIVSNGEDALGEPVVCDEESHSNIGDGFQRYKNEWLQLCRDARDADDLGELRRRALLGKLRASRFRSLSWRLLLRLLPPDPDAWPTVLHDQREHYAKLSSTHHINPAAYAEDDPLSQDTQSSWNQYFCNKELQDVIRQDVVRTFPGIDFFREMSIQDKMVSILFCYARANPDMCYRQGMHEILAPLMFVLRSDHEALMHTREHAPVSWEIIKVLDPQHLEADAYTLFCRIMSGIECCYRINDITPTNTGHFPYEILSVQERRESSKQETELMAQLIHIRDTLLIPHDAQLAQHLQKLDIPLTLFGIRWLRLLFGREFPLQDILVLWDAIFAEAEGGSCFELVNYIVVAMLIAIRYQLLSGDYTTCLSHLMRYPGAVDVTNIIAHSLYLKYPEKYCPPDTISFPNLPVITIGGRPDMNRGPLNVSAAVIKKESEGENHGEQREVKDKKAKGGKKKDALSKRLGKLSAARWGKSPQKQLQQTNVPILPSNEDEAIVEGYALNHPNLLEAQLQRAVQLIRSSQSQLAEHLSALESSSIDVEPSVKHALNGIRKVHLQLCKFQCEPVDVEPATEAGEIRMLTPQKPAPVPPSHISLQPQQQNSVVELKLIQSSFKGPDDKIEGAPQADPLNMRS